MHRLSVSRSPRAVSRSTRSTAARADGPSRPRSPSTFTRTPCPRSSSTSPAMYSSSRSISAEISVGGRCQFSSEKANSVSTSTPAAIAPSTTSRTAFIPARWPSGRGRWRSRAQRPLPSMMTATWRGTAPLSRMSRRRSSATLDLHDLLLLRLHRLIHQLQVVVVELLDVLLRVLLLVVGDVLGLLDPVDRLGAGAPHGDAPLLGELVDHLHQLAAPLLGERRDGQADDGAGVGRREPQVGGEQRLLDRLEERLVPRLHGQQLRLGRRDVRHLVERHFAAVPLDPHEVEHRGRRLPRAHGGELPLHGLHRLVHQLFRLLAMILQRGSRAHWTRVPTRSPARIRAVAPGWLMLNTTMGSLFSLHRPKAFASITAYPCTSASWKASCGRNVAARSRFGSAV